VNAMEVSRLAELYFSKAETSPLSRAHLEEEIACLINSCGWSSEQVFFAINYSSRYFPQEPQG
jgi:hypothetical protein